MDRGARASLFEAETAEDVRAFLSLNLTETEVLEYKRDLSADLSPVVAAFANTEGGTIVVGADEVRATKGPRDTGGFVHRSPRSAVTSQLQAYLDPVPPFETTLVPADDERAYMLIRVAPSTTRVVLHREKGILVRVGDQCVAPNRSAFERLIAREAAARDAVDMRLRSAQGRAGLLNGPGGTESRLLVSVAIDPLAELSVVPADPLDDLLANVGNLVLGGGFKARVEPGRSAAERAIHPEVIADRISLSTAGALDIRFCAQPHGWHPPGFQDWELDPTQLAIDICGTLVTAFAIGADARGPVVLPAAAAISFSGWNGKALVFPHERHIRPSGPVSPSALQIPVVSGLLAEAPDALTLAIAAVRGLARFYGQRGGDTWAARVPALLAGRPNLDPWFRAAAAQ